MSAPVLPTPTSAADAPAAPKPRLRWDDVLSDEEGGGTDTAAGGGGATAVSGWMKWTADNGFMIVLHNVTLMQEV